VKLHLDYIVYRPSAPFASINDQQVRIGSIIEGFEVTEISPDLVKLHGARGTVVLRTH
jgi:chaperone required for assembly of F1-ATPase